jgi:hypothetical protein
MIDATISNEFSTGARRCDYALIDAFVIIYI